MGFRFRLGPFTFGTSGVRLSIWSRGTGVSIPLTNTNKAKSFGKVSFGNVGYYANEKPKNKRIERSENPQIQEIRKSHKQAYEPWTAEADEKLIILFRQGRTVTELSVMFGRTNGAIRSE
jgi:hypothetical protein